MKNQLLLSLFSLSFIFSTYSQNWSEVGNGVNGDIYTSIEFNGNLIIGGDFSQVGGNLNVYNIASWNGSAWTNMGKGFDDDVKSLVIYNNELYAGGNFRRNGDNSTIFDGNIAKWNGSDWVTVQGIGWNSEYSNSPIKDMKVFDNKLYVIFNRYYTALSDSRSILSTFDGTNWVDLCDQNFLIQTTFGASMFKLGIFENELIIGGRFDGFISTNSSSIIKYNGTNFEAFVSPLIYGNTYSIVQVGNKLYLGGLFEYQASTETITPNLISFDGSNWTAHPFNINNAGEINDIITKNDSIFVLGRFDFYDPNNTSNTIARAALFDPNLSYPFKNLFFYNSSSSSSDAIYTSQVFQNKLIVGGKFDYSGSSSAENLAQLDPGNPNVNLTENDFTPTFVYPNPFTDYLIINSDKDLNQKYSIYNLQGEKLKEGSLNNNKIDTEEFCSGTYIIEIGEKNFIRVK
ncbi:MAG: T9SS type A sorting domain-containing protein [Flavobacteriia bacterium]|nr:T9SS type A sorting domain-containing protein [Flavobacteriia bacterium]